MSDGRETGEPFHFNNRENNMVACDIRMIEIYWDNTDLQGGWAWRVTKDLFDDDYQESGALDDNDLDRDASNEEMRDAVENFAFIYHDLNINAEDVNAECTRDGGYAVWQK
jgi:hypothetical protein